MPDNIIPFPQPEDDDEQECWIDYLADLHERLTSLIENKQPWDAINIELQAADVTALLTMIEVEIGADDE